MTASNAAGSQDAWSTAIEIAPVAPTSTGLPSITGTLEVGRTLATDNGTWAGTTPMSFRYGWLRCSVAHTSCQQIPGATSSSYALTADDAGSTLRSFVQAANSGGAGTAESDYTAVVTLPVRPSVTDPPQLSGIAQVGQTLSVTDGTWAGSQPITLTYAWQRCTTAHAGCGQVAEGSNTYRTVAADEGHTVRALVIATNLGGTTTGRSDFSATIEVPPASLDGVTLSGSAVIGDLLTLSLGNWRGTAPLTFTYAWMRCNVAHAGCGQIVSATGLSYRLDAVDEGHTIRVIVTATNDAGTAVSRTDFTSMIVRLPTVGDPPLILGDATVGQTLSVINGSWNGTGPLTYAYAWQRCDASQSSCADVGSGSTDYPLTAADAGHTIRAVVTATNDGGSGVAYTVFTPAVTMAPLLLYSPIVSGVAQVGQLLSVSTGSWLGTEPMTYSFAWQRCNAAHAGCGQIAVGMRYRLTAADEGHTFRVIVTASNSAGSVSARSTITDVILRLPANTAAPTLSGTPQVGQTLSTTDGSWLGSDPLTYTYSWQRCNSLHASCGTIVGQTGNSYPLRAADQDHTIRVVVTATNAAGSAAARSDFSATVTRVPAATDTPTITGTTQVGSLLTGSTGSWVGTAPISYVYTWYRCNAAHASCGQIATGLRYRLVTVDEGHTIRFVVAASNAIGSAQARSGFTATVAGIPPANTVAPTLSGTARVGNALSTSRGSWTGTGTIAYTYSWQRCNSLHASCGTIPGQTGSSYVLVAPSDVGHTFRAVITATNAAGETTVRTGFSDLVQH